MMARRLGLPVRLAVAATTLLTLSFSRPARGSEFVLVWDAPPECPGADVVRKQMLERLGNQRAGLALKAHATVTHDPPVFRVRLHTYRAGQRGLRSLEAPTCSALVDAITVIVALAADSEPLAESSPDSPAASPDGRGRPAARGDASTALRAAPATAASTAISLDGPDGSGGAGASTPESAANVRPQERGTAGAPTVAEGAAAAGVDSKLPVIDDTGEASGRPFTDLGVQGVASLAGSVESGILPGLGFGVTLRGGVRFRRVRVEGALSRWFARQAQSSSPGSGADVDGVALAAWGCFRAVPGHTAPVPGLRSALPPDDAPAIEAGPCLGVEVGHLQARSFGIAETADGSGSYVAAGGGLRLGATASDWLSLDVRFEAFRVLHAPEFRVENLGVVHEPALWSLRAALGAEAYFP